MKLFFAKYYKWILLLMFFAQEAFSRAGGGGGGHSSGGGHGGGHGGGYSGGGGGGGDISFYLIEAFVRLQVWCLFHPLPGWLVLVVEGAVLFAWLRHRSANYEGQSAFVTAASMPSFQSNILDPAETDQLIAKARMAFMQTQEAWPKKDISIIRRFISDGVYQRFNAQYLMMNRLDQENPISEINILRCSLVKCEVDGQYQSADIAIHASMRDQFISNKYPHLLSPGGLEDFIEVWSFIRKTDRPKISDIYSSHSCPSCAAPLAGKLIETARCSYCGSYLNNAEFDWVLSEITQLEDYSRGIWKAELDPNLNQQIRSIRLSEPHFSKQLLEDRASNAALQLLIASSLADGPRIQRICRPEVAQALVGKMDSKMVYDRLFLSSVELLNLDFQKDKWVLAKIGVGLNYRRVQLVNQQANLLDGDVVFQKRYITLIHKLDGSASKGSIYSNCCPSCGAQQKDSLNSECSFCGAVLLDPTREWVVQSVN